MVSCGGFTRGATKTNCHTQKSKKYRAAATAITKCFYDPLTRVPFPILLSTPVVICLHYIIELKGEGETKNGKQKTDTHTDSSQVQAL